MDNTIFPLTSGAHAVMLQQREGQIEAGGWAPDPTTGYEQSDRRAADGRRDKTI